VRHTQHQTFLGYRSEHILVARGADRMSPAGLFPAGFHPLLQVSALKWSPRALGVPYRGRMGKRDALASLVFRLTAYVRRVTPATVAC